MQTETVSPELITEHFSINVDDQYWYSEITAEFREKLEAMGFSDVTLRFSGFCSQGDGASFLATIPPWGLREFMDKTAGKDKFPMVRKLMAADGEASVSIIEHRGCRYVHHNSVYADPDYQTFELILDQPTEIQEQAVEAYDTLLHEEMDALTEHVRDLHKSLACEYYALLEAEYEYQTSDEAITATIIANQLHKEI